MKLDNFQNEINSTIFVRGVRYFQAGKVTRIEETEKGFYEAVVSGNYDYDVEIRIDSDNNTVLSFYCDCPYGFFCKHCAAVLFSLKAGGTGLNLTGADIVIHCDPWWNVSAENQASDRAYRIGQKRNVQIYKLIARGTIEEKICDLQKNKAELAVGGEVNIMHMNSDDILDLLN